MALRSICRLEHPTTSQTSSSAQAINTHGFPTLPDEIYLEIMSYLPPVPIPTKFSPLYPEYPEMRRSRHETLLSLSQTSRSLRRFFLRYLWQRIEVRDGMKIGDEDSASKSTRYLGRNTRDYNTELVRQLEIVTIRNPKLVQYVKLEVLFGSFLPQLCSLKNSYLDVCIGEYSFKTVLAELAHCLSMFSNLHTVQIDTTLGATQSLNKVVERTFRKYSYPQIRILYVMDSTESLIASCPGARRVGFIHPWDVYLQRGLQSYMDAIFDNCPLLQVFDAYLPQPFCTVDTCKRLVNAFPNLRTITVTPSAKVGPHIDLLNELRHLQTAILCWFPSVFILSVEALDLSSEQKVVYLDGMMKIWIRTLKGILMQAGLRDNLEKKLVVQDSWG